MNTVKVIYLDLAKNCGYAGSTNGELTSRGSVLLKDGPSGGSSKVPVTVTNFKTDCRVFWGAYKKLNALTRDYDKIIFEDSTGFKGSSTNSDRLRNLLRSVLIYLKEVNKIEVEPVSPVTWQSKRDKWIKENVSDGEIVLFQTNYKSILGVKRVIQKSKMKSHLYCYKKLDLKIKCSDEADAVVMHSCI